jgi:transposase
MIGRRKLTPKQRALQEGGTLNARADAVHDPAFTQGEFFDAADLVQVRYEMLRRVRTEGVSVTDAVARFGLTRPTFYKLQADFERAGLAGLLPAKRGPHGPHKLTAEVMRVIDEARQEQPQLDGPALVELVWQRCGVLVHRRTVERALVRPKKKPR